MRKRIKFELSQDESMVLFEILQELENKELIKRESDKRVLWHIEGIIERQSDFLINNPKYKEQLEEIRKKLSSDEQYEEVRKKLSK